MSTLQQARTDAAALSMDGAVRHIAATIRAYGSGYSVDPDGYHVSAWCSDATVESYVKGKQID